MSNSNVVQLTRSARALSSRRQPACTTLDGRQENTLRNALVVAAERYDEHAKEFQANADRAKADPAWAASHEGGMVHHSIYQPMADQFTLQADNVRALIDLMDGPEDHEGSVQVRVVLLDDDAF